MQQNQQISRRIPAVYECVITLCMIFCHWTFSIWGSNLNPLPHFHVISQTRRNNGREFYIIYSSYKLNLHLIHKQMVGRMQWPLLLLISTHCLHSIYLCWQTVHSISHKMWKTYSCWWDYGSELGLRLTKVSCCANLSYMHMPYTILSHLLHAKDYLGVESYLTVWFVVSVYTCLYVNRCLLILR